MSAPYGYYDLILGSDRRSLQTQIKTFIVKAQQVACDELNRRRLELKQLLDGEEKVYQQEFANKVKSRIDMDIKKRRDELLKIREENTKVAEEFLETKRIQQYMNSCYEIREALRRKDKVITKECQLAQMLEKERKTARKRATDKQWSEAHLLNFQHEDKRTMSELCQHKLLAVQTAEVLKMQIQEVKRRRELECELKAAEAAEIDKIVREVSIEKAEGQRKKMTQNTLQYRNELLAMIEERKAAECAEDIKQAESHCELMQEVQREEAAEHKAINERKKALRKATLDYIEFVKNMRQLEQQQQRQRDTGIDELRRVDICTKKNIQAELARKADLAAKCHAELKRQMCEEHERRLRDKAEQRENKILENRFVHPLVTPEQLLAKKRKNRQLLDDHVAEITRYRAAEAAKFDQQLKHAINDAEFCDSLAKQYMSEGIDCLPPHPNWLVFGCAQRKLPTNYVCVATDKLQEIVACHKSLEESDLKKKS